MEISNISISDLKKIFDKFEEDNKIFYNEHSYIWEGVRFDVFNLIIVKFLGNKDSHDTINIKNLSVLYKIRLGLYLIKRYILTKPIFVFKKNKEKYVFWGHSRRKLEEDGYYWDIYVDPIISYLNNRSYLILENQYQFRHFLPVITKNLLYPDYMMLEIAIKRILLYRKNIDRNKAKYFKELEDKLKIEFKTDIEILSIVKRYDQLYNYKVKQFTRLLQKVNPKILFIVVGYGRETLIHAAKKLHIPVVELQHGMLSEYHLGYDVSSGEKEDFADYFFSFGPAWGRMANFPIPQEKIIPIGYQYLNNAIDKYKNVKKKNQVIFLSQGTIGDRLSKFAVKLISNLSLDIKIFYKLHPGEYLRWKTEYKDLYAAYEKGYISVIAGDDPPLYQIMAESKWQIGVNSTALFEGMAFKCKTFVVNLPGIEDIKNMIESKRFFLVQDPKEINFNYNSDDIDYSNDDYFTKDTEARFIAAIEFVMKDYHI